jgi:hypothetical protein
LSDRIFSHFYAPCPVLQYDFLDTDFTDFTDLPNHSIREIRVDPCPDKKYPAAKSLFEMLSSPKQPVENRRQVGADTLVSPV